MGFVINFYAFTVTVHVTLCCPAYYYCDIVTVRAQYGSSRHSYQPMTFKKPDGDPYQQSFLLFSSSLTEHSKKDTVSDQA